MSAELVIRPGEIITWMGLAFETNDQVLVPRRETELLARAALELLKTVEAAPIRVIDMCCGAGNLACALAHARPDIRVWASDLTDACVGLARKNVAGHGLEGRVDVRQGDLFSSLPDEELVGSVDLVDRGRNAGYPAPPVQTRTGPTKASGSYLGCLAAKRTAGQG